MLDNDFQSHHALDFNSDSGFSNEYLYGDFEGDDEDE